MPPEPKVRLRCRPLGLALHRTTLDLCGEIALRASICGPRRSHRRTTFRTDEPSRGGLGTERYWPWHLAVVGKTFTPQEPMVVLATAVP